MIGRKESEVQWRVRQSVLWELVHLSGEEELVNMNSRSSSI